MKPNSFLSDYDDRSMFSNFDNYAQSLDYNAPQIFMDSSICGDASLNLLSTEQEQHDNWLIEPEGHQPAQKSSLKATIDISSQEERLKNGISGSSDISEQQKSSQYKMQTKSSTSFNISPSQNFSPQTKVPQTGPLFKNETKNIPKNFGKAIIIFIQKHRAIVEPIIVQNGDKYDELLSGLVLFKKGVNSILDIRQLWEFHPSAKSIRMISNYFLRRCSLGYIYNSKILSRVCHAKYKNRFLEALRNPTNFSCIKNY